MFVTSARRCGLGPHYRAPGTWEKFRSSPPSLGALVDFVVFFDSRPSGLWFEAVVAIDGVHRVVHVYIYDLNYGSTTLIGERGYELSGAAHFGRKAAGATSLNFRSRSPDTAGSVSASY